MIPIFLAAATAAASPVPAEPLRYDMRGRPLVQVRVDAREPIDMVVDTAAERSFITPNAARAMALPAAETGLSITGATGNEQAQSYRVSRFHNMLFDRREIALIGLPSEQALQSPGIIGMDMFPAHRLLFDRTARQLSTGPSIAAPAGYATVKGNTTSSGLLVVPLTINGKTVRALVDTGAAKSIASPGLLRLLGWSSSDPRLREGGAIRGATAGDVGVRVARMDLVKIGPATLRNVELLFTPQEDDDDGDPADRSDLILGVDLLDLLDAFAVDFKRSELQIRLPRPTVTPQN